MRRDIVVDYAAGMARWAKVESRLPLVEGQKSRATEVPIHRQSTDSSSPQTRFVAYSLSVHTLSAKTARIRTFRLGACKPADYLQPAPTWIVTSRSRP